MFHLDTSAFINPAVYHTIEIVYLAIVFTCKRQKKIVLPLPIPPTLQFYSTHCGFSLYTRIYIITRALDKLIFRVTFSVLPYFKEHYFILICIWYVCLIVIAYFLLLPQIYELCFTKQFIYCLTFQIFPIMLEIMLQLTFQAWDLEGEKLYFSTTKLIHVRCTKVRKQSRTLNISIYICINCLHSQVFPLCNVLVAFFLHTCLA